MTSKNLVFNTIYTADNGQFSSTSRRAVERWEELELDVHKLDRAEYNLWACKGDLKVDRYGYAGV